MTIQDKLVTLRVKDFRHLLTEEVQPCGINFQKHKLNADINKTHWEAVFKSTKETRLMVTTLDSSTQHLPNQHRPTTTQDGHQNVRKMQCLQCGRKRLHRTLFL